MRLNWTESTSSAVCLCALAYYVLAYLWMSSIHSLICVGKIDVTWYFALKLVTVWICKCMEWHGNMGIACAFGGEKTCTVFLCVFSFCPEVALLTQSQHKHSVRRKNNNMSLKKLKKNKIMKNLRRNCKIVEKYASGCCVGCAFKPSKGKHVQQHSSAVYSTTPHFTIHRNDELPMPFVWLHSFWIYVSFFSLLGEWAW